MELIIGKLEWVYFCSRKQVYILGQEYILI